MKYFLIGDSWAIKGFNQNNYKIVSDVPLSSDFRFTDFYELDYNSLTKGGLGNLSLLDAITNNIKLEKNIPIIWVFTEPGRDYGRVYNKPQHEWITREDFFKIRLDLTLEVLKIIRKSLNNEIGLIGGLSDVPLEAKKMGFTILESSWQQKIAIQCGYSDFEIGWGAADIGWRNKSNKIKPSDKVLRNCLKHLKFWNSCAKFDLMFACHPTVEAHKRLAESLKQTIYSWLNVDFKS